MNADSPQPDRPSASSAPKRQRWSGRTRGGAWLFRFCVSLLPYVGAHGAWLISFGIALFFLPFGGRDQFGMVPFWRRLRPHAGYPLLLMLAYRQFASFGRVLCDRLLVYLRPDSFTIDVRGVQRLHELHARGQGCILMSAHLGNWELASFWLHNLAAAIGPVNVVMVRDDVEFVQDFVDQRLRGSFTRVIDPRDGLGASLAINAALSAGEVVCVLGDRVFGEQPTMTVDFLGRPARFPLGPIQAAALTGAPILVGFLMKTGMRSYSVHVDAPWYVRMPARRSERSAALKGALQRWARRLELQVRRHPQQWHNFYDFWS